MAMIISLIRLGVGLKMKMARKGRQGEKNTPHVIASGRRVTSHQRNDGTVAVLEKERSAAVAEAGTGDEGEEGEGGTGVDVHIPDPEVFPQGHHQKRTRTSRASSGMVFSGSSNNLLP